MTETMIEEVGHVAYAPPDKSVRITASYAGSPPGNPETVEVALENQSVPDGPADLAGFISVLLGYLFRDTDPNGGVDTYTVQTGDGCRVSARDWDQLKGRGLR